MAVAALIDTKTTSHKPIFYLILSLILTFISLTVIYNINPILGILAYCIANISIYQTATSEYRDKKDKEIKLNRAKRDKEIEQEKEEEVIKKELEIKELKEKEYKAAQELLHKAENGDHKAAIELSHNNKDNNIEAYYWNLVAEASGSREAISNKANILNEMSDLQINIAQEKFKKWLNDKIGMTLSNIYAPLKTQASFGGCVYIMTCDKWTEDGLVKIGKSNNVQRRLNEAQKEVQGTYSPNPPTIKLYHDQFSRYYNELEKHIHLKLQDRRFKSDTSTATEFFRLTPEEAKAELDIAIREIEEKMAS